VTVGFLGDALTRRAAAVLEGPPAEFTRDLPAILLNASHYQGLDAQYGGTMPVAGFDIQELYVDNRSSSVLEVRVNGRLTYRIAASQGWRIAPPVRILFYEVFPDAAVNANDITVLEKGFRRDAA
jgi:hypothetical protein